MPRSFAITTVADRVNLDAARRGSTSVTVTNSTGKPLRAWAELKELGSTKKEWLVLDGAGEKSFSPNEAQTFKVTVNVPQDAAAGRYEFKLNMISGNKGAEEESTEGPVVGFEVAQPPPPPPPPRTWLFIVLGVVVVGGMVAAVLLLHTSKVEVPTVRGKSLSEAITLLASKSLTNKVEYQRATTNSADTVFNQNPNPGEKIKPGEAVTLFVEAGPASTPVPDFKGPHYTIEQAIPVANNAKVMLNLMGSQYNSDPKLNGRIVDQDHKAGTPVPEFTTKISVWVGTTNKIKPFLVDPIIKAKLLEHQNTVRRISPVVR
jgi:hypothetical protein